MSKQPGISGRLADRSVRSQLTPLLAGVALLLGIFAALVTPREEEPQIDVTMANVFVPFPAASASDVENLVTLPLEQVLAEIEQVEHIYSVSQQGMAVLTVQFAVNVPRQTALLRLYNAIYSNTDWRPQGLGVGPVMVKPKGIDDVPILALTLWSDQPDWDPMALKQLASGLESELKRLPGTRNISTIGGDDKVVRLTLDPQRLAAHNLSIAELAQALMASHQALPAGALVDNNRYLDVQAGTFLSHPDELGELVVGLHQGRPVYLQDVADIRLAASDPVHYVSWRDRDTAINQPAITLTVSKKPGENAIDVADRVLSHVDGLRGNYIADGINIEVTRNYGATANDKANKLIQKLVFATLSVIVLVLVSLGRREAIVVGAAVLLTLAATLFASWAWGFTLNRVSLFALIFSIGILVDDAIVVVENVHRHLGNTSLGLVERIAMAVDEVGGPTILATFTVIAALLPMAFVTGLMGPYMSPIPINASMGMVLSLLIAFTFTPWLCARLLKSGHDEHPADNGIALFGRLIRPFLGSQRKNRYLLAGGLLLAIALAIVPVFTTHVVLKMLPFDNKSELQVVVDMPEGTPLEMTDNVLTALADYLVSVDEVDNLQLYSGTASPIGFNGLVRQYYLRSLPHQGDIQVNLVDKHQRDRQSHAIALSLREPLQAIGRRFNANIKIVEVPPGPPVMSPIVAEIYGPDYASQQQLARQLEQVFIAEHGIVDTDTSVEADHQRLLLAIDRQRAAMLGISQQEAASAIAAALGGMDAIYLHTGKDKQPLAAEIRLARENQRSVADLSGIKIRSRDGTLVSLDNIVRPQQQPLDKAIHHKDLLPVVYVTADMAGQLDSPLYGMFGLRDKLPDGIQEYFIRQPEYPQQFSLKWDGEWQITYETFRDMGAAYSVGLLLIYLLVVGQFRSYSVPLIIMAPIPLTLIGILPGHALFGAQFTATSMIGMIALAGIIVRNSILLVDFVNHARAAGSSLEDAVSKAAQVRAKPIILTALAAMMGAFFILDDPIFNGLAISLISGLLVSTLLTLVVIPVMYYALLHRQLNRKAAAA
ncbi:MAG TPA: efflux RND transporter permease subunit [Pseudomonadales bacterium]